MHLCKLKNLIGRGALLVILLFCNIIENSKGIDDDEVILYGKHIGGKIDYKYNTAEWEDIPKLLQSQGVTANFTDICARGTWLVYEDEHLVNDATDTLNLYGISVLTSDVEKCVPITEFGHDVSSVQLVTSYHKRKGPVLVFFQFERFIGRKMMIDKAIKLPDELPGFYTLIKSVISVGRQEWEIVMDGNIHVCFRPPQNMTNPVCLISHLIDDDQLIDGGVLQASHRREPCDNDNDIIVEMRDCYENDVGIIHPNATGPLGPAVVEPGTNETECEDSEEILTDEHIELIASRLNGSLGSGNWFSAIADPKQVWKAELFDKAFQVLSKICPESVIDDEYLLTFASLYFHHMGLIWEEGRFVDVTIPEVDWMEMLHDMSQCVQIVNSGDYDGIGAETATEMHNYKSLEDVTGKLETMFGFKPDYDHVMEINYFMANLVASICTKAREYDRNFLPRFLNIYHVLYFSPVEKQWEHPDKYERIYKYLFGGYGMQKSLIKIALCTFHAMKFSGVTLPYKRPMDQAEPILLPKIEGEERVINGTTEAP